MSDVHASVRPGSKRADDKQRVASLLRRQLCQNLNSRLILHAHLVGAEKEGPWAFESTSTG